MDRASRVCYVTAVEFCTVNSDESKVCEPVVGQTHTFFLTSFTIPLKIKIENIKGEAETMSDVKERKAPDRSHPR